MAFQSDLDKIVTLVRKYDKATGRNRRNRRLGPRPVVKKGAATPKYTSTRGHLYELLAGIYEVGVLYYAKKDDLAQLSEEELEDVERGPKSSPFHDLLKQAFACLEEDELRLHRGIISAWAKVLEKFWIQRTHPSDFLKELVMAGGIERVRTSSMVTKKSVSGRS